MNFLAHLHLAQARPVVEAIGNLTADHCRDDGGAAFRRGVMLHRRIDAYTDAHPLMAEARALFPPPFRRFGGVLSDLVFDHCLARTWGEWHAEETLERFVDGQLAVMLAADAQVPESAIEVMQAMRRGRWMQGYARIEGMKITLERMVRRRPKATPMLGAESVMASKYANFEQLFRAFYPQLQAEVC